MADKIVSWGGIDSKGTSGMGVTGSLTVSGNVGIGTSTPARTLEVNGTIGTTADGVGRGITMGTAVAGASSYFNVGQGTGWLFHLTTNNATYTANSTRMTITDNGVGFGNFVANGGTVSATTQVRGSGTTSSTTALLVQNSNGTNLFKISDSAVQNAFMYSYPMTNNGGLTLQATVGTTETPALFLRPNTGLNGANIYVLDNKIYFRLINTNEVGSDSVYVFATDNRKAKFGVSADDSTTDASIYGKAIWDGGAAATFRRATASQTANIFNIQNESGSVNYFNVGATGNVGIGTSTPSASLHVTGSTLITGSLTFNGSDLSTAWTSYTPTWEGQVSNPSLGDGSITGAYKVIGKTCFVRIKLNYGSTTSGGSGAWWFGLPFTGSNADGIQMACSMLDNGNAWYQGIANGTYAGYAHKTAIIAQSPGSNSSQGVDLGFPFVWGNTDSLQFAGSYEIA